MPPGTVRGKDVRHLSVSHQHWLSPPHSGLHLYVDWGSTAEAGKGKDEQGALGSGAGVVHGTVHACGRNPK